MKSLNLHLKYWLNATLNSYSQIFFSLNKVLSVLILLTTFFTPHLGLAGLAAIVIVNSLAHLFGINRKLIEEGLFGFNAMLLGLFLAGQYEINAAFVLLFIVSLFFLLITGVWLNGVFGKHGLPFLSFPFIVTYWVTALSVGNFSNIHFNEANVYVYNHLETLKENGFYQAVHCMDTVQMPKFLLIYFKTLAGTFFQTSVLAGIIIAGGILYFSRIAFSLSLLGFGFAYLFYSAFGADVLELELNLVGSNFIFMAIGIGCFYIIPNFYSYFSVFLLTPIIMLTMIFFTKILAVFQLRSFTLSFSVVVVLFLLFLQHRWFHRFLHLVTLQYYSAEKTIYKYITSMKRFSTAHLAKVYLPFWGDWYVSQGYDGKITHLGEWGKALDFVIVDDERKTFQETGAEKKDFYCFNKPIVAPMDGFVYDILNTVEDNAISDVNTGQNWGNTIILNHTNGLFTQISHIKKDSFKVAIGDYVTRGSVLATCGNSGRSPEPHIHFQLQTSPKIGGKTLPYPIAYFIEKQNKAVSLRISEIPKEDTIISNIDTHTLLLEGFYLHPGKKMTFTDENGRSVVWEVLTDQFNRTYLYCRSSKAIAYFVYDGTMFYFYDFEGSKKTLLFQFYLAAYRVLLGCYENLPVEDSLPLIHFNLKILQWVQDFVAPFYRFTKARYESLTTGVDNINEPSEAVIKSKIEATFLGLKIKQIDFEIKVKDKQIQELVIFHKGQKSTYSCEY